MNMEVKFLMRLKSHLYGYLGRLLVVAGVLLAISFFSFGPGVGIGQQLDLPHLTRKFGDTAQPADFVIVIDKSGSMKKFWATVKASVADFVEVIPEGDYVSILYFEAGSGELLTPRRISAANRQSFKEQILALPDPAGRATDLGLGLDRTLDELNRPNPNRLQFVFFFTDFKHDPPAQSKWSAKDCSSASWAQLQEKKRRLVDAQDHVAKFYALKLRIDEGAGRDLGLFECVAGYVEQVTIDDSAGLREWFDRKKKDINRDKIKIQVENEINNCVTIEAGTAQSAASFPLVISSRCKKLDVSIDSVAVAGADERGEYTLRPADVQPFTLAPGERKEIALGFDQKTSQWKARLETCETREARARVDVRVTLQPADEVRVLLEPAKLVSGDLSARVPFCFGIPLWTIGAALLVLILLAAVIYYIWIRPETLTGTVVIKKETTTQRKEIFGRRFFYVGNTADCKQEGICSDKFDSGKPIEIEFRGRKPGLFSSRPRRGAYVRMRKGIGQMQVDKLDPATNKFKKVSVSVPMEFSKSDEPINSSTVLKVGDCTIKWE
jgi:Mg-chelatase subunit ChlD